MAMFAHTPLTRHNNAYLLLNFKTTYAHMKYENHSNEYLYQSVKLYKHT